jgi:dienelactone hydrolase
MKGPCRIGGGAGFVLAICSVAIAADLPARLRVHCPAPVLRPQRSPSPKGPTCCHAESASSAHALATAHVDDLRTAGHIVHTPDLFDGHTFQSIDEGLAYISKIGFDEMRERGVRVADKLPPDLVCAGFSFGVLPAQKLAQTRPGARGAVLFYSGLPISGEWAFGPWSDGVAVQIHGMDNDPIFVGEGDIDAAREIVENCERSEAINRAAWMEWIASSLSLLAMTASR